MSSWKSVVVTAFLSLFGLFLTVGGADAKCALKLPAGLDKAVPVKRLNQTLLDKAILGHVNFERCKRGRPALQGSSGLRKQASTHAQWMARHKKLSHNATGTSRRRLTDRLKGSGVRYRTGAENIGMVHFYQIDGRHFVIRSRDNCVFETRGGTRIARHSYGSLAKLIVRKWMESPGHRKNIMKRNVRFTGAGAGISPYSAHCGSVFLTQILAG